MSMIQEFYEIKILVECPDCKKKWYDWIVYEPNLPEIVEEKCSDCRILDTLIREEFIREKMREIRNRYIETLKRKSSCSFDYSKLFE